MPILYATLVAVKFETCQGTMNSALTGNNELCLSIVDVSRNNQEYNVNHLYCFQKTLYINVDLESSDKARQLLGGANAPLVFFNKTMFHFKEISYYMHPHNSSAPPSNLLVTT